MSNESRINSTRPCIPSLVRAKPFSVRVTSQLLLSVSDWCLVTNPLDSKCLRRLVIAPEVRKQLRINCLGVCEYGSPARSRAARTSKPQFWRSKVDKYLSVRRSIWRESTTMRPPISKPRLSSDGTSFSHSSTTSSIKSAGSELPGSMRLDKLTPFQTTSRSSTRYLRVHQQSMMREKLSHPTHWSPSMSLAVPTTPTPGWVAVMVTIFCWLGRLATTTPF